MNVQKKLAAIGLSVGLIGGGAAGAIMSTSGISGAAPTAIQQDESTENPGEKGDRGDHLADVLAPLVEDGTLNQEQADAVVAALQEARPEGRKGHRGAKAHLGAVAESLGIDTEAFREAIQGGSTPAEAAEAQGVDTQALVDAMVAEATDRINTAVAEEKITQEEADEKLDGLSEKITERVTSPVPERGDRGPGGPRGPQPDSAEEDTES